MKRLGIYIHVPFCYKKCGYCSFNSFDDKLEFLKPYLTSLHDEIELRSQSMGRHLVTSIFFGGGTPTFLSAEAIENMLTLLCRRFTLAERVEISMEGNPVSLPEKYLQKLHAAGINRLSLGVQSFREDLLDVLKRRHCGRDIITTVETARKCGFDNLSLDLMFGIPTQTVSDWEEELRTLLTLRPEHISTYNLTLEKNSELFNAVEDARFTVPDDDEQVEMYENGIEILGNAGYNHYEISNFSKPGYDCSHNRLYWENRNYLGFGPGACSHIQEKRYENFQSIEQYIRSLQDKKLPVCFSETLSPEKKMREMIFMNLRLLEGVNKNSFRLRFGSDMMNTFGSEVKNLVDRGLLFNEKERIRLTRKGVLFSNTVFMEFV